jgi:hypothetical protein
VRCRLKASFSGIRKSHAPHNIIGDFIHIWKKFSIKLQGGARNDPVFDLVLNILPCNE